MAEESQAVDPYEVVLADLRAKRAQIDQAIEAIESVRGNRAASAPAKSDAASAVGTGIDEPGAFLGMTIPDAAKKLLASRRKTMSNSEITAAFKAGGLAMNSVDPVNTIGSVLTRRFNVVGDIVRVGRGVWGLAEWYPNRSFKKKAAKDAMESPHTTINGEPTSFGPAREPSGFSSPDDPDPWSPLDGPIGSSEMEQ
jgi:hypothetical protein